MTQSILYGVGIHSYPKKMTQSILYGVGIHSYLGIHVIKRKVIFVDLALAQIAALGTIVALCAGLPPHTIEAYIFSLLFTFIGAAVFSLTRLKDEKIPQEAVIGLVYALAAAITVLVIDRAPHGAEHIKEILTGAILWVKWEAIAASAVVYAAVGVFHFVFRRRFFLISDNPEKAFEAGISVRLWDFLFYLSFGLVITLSVHTAGVLLVFVFLVVPAIMAILITDRLVYQLLIGWGTGVLVSIVGLGASYTYDFPSGPMVVSVYGAALLMVALSLYVAKSKNRKKALLHIVVGAAGVVLIISMFYGLSRLMSKEEHKSADTPISPPETEDYSAPSTAPRETADHGADLIKSLLEMDLIQKQQKLSEIKSPKPLVAALEKTEDEELRLALAARLLEMNRAEGRRVLVETMASAPVPMFRSEALDLLEKKSGDNFGFDPMSDPTAETNRKALDRWRVWLQKD